MLLKRVLSLNESVLSLSPNHHSLSILKYAYNILIVIYMDSAYIYLYQLQKTVPNAKIGFSKAMSAGWLRIDKQAQGGPRVFRKVVNISVSAT